MVLVLLPFYCDRGKYDVSVLTVLTTITIVILALVCVRRAPVEYWCVYSRGARLKRSYMGINPIPCYGYFREVRSRA